MALSVIGSGNSNGKLVITITSDNPAHNLAIAELQGPEARRLAIKQAGQNGVNNARCEMPSAPYAVDSEGSAVVRPTEQKIDEYRVDVPISTGF